MTHMKQMSEFEGVFNEQQTVQRKCRKCSSNTAILEVWESSCGGYENYKYTCQECKSITWIDVIDS